MIVSAKEREQRKKTMPSELEIIEPKVKAPVQNLRSKLAEIRCRIHNIEKRGRNDFHKYSYAMASDLQGVIGTELAEAGIVLARRNLTIKRSEGQTSKGNVETIVEVFCDYGLLDADSDEQIWQPAYGEGRDQGDKAAYKAFTGALKYFLIQAFSLATGDDPEDSAELDAKREARKAQPRKEVVGLKVDDKLGENLAAVRRSNEMEHVEPADDPADSFPDDVMPPPPITLNEFQVKELDELLTKCEATGAPRAKDFRARCMKGWEINALSEMAQADFQRRKEGLEAQVEIFKNFGRVYEGKK